MSKESAGRCDERHVCTELTPLSAAGTVTQDAEAPMKYHRSDLMMHSKCWHMAQAGKVSPLKGMTQSKKVEPWSPEDESEAQV